MTLTGIEEYFLMPAVESAWHAIGLEATDPSVGYHQGTFGRRLADLADERLALMDETALDVRLHEIPGFAGSGSSADSSQISSFAEDSKKVPGAQVCWSRTFCVGGTGGRFMNCGPKLHGAAACPIPVIC